jgi:hypothetical protein
VGGRAAGGYLDALAFSRRYTDAGSVEAMLSRLAIRPQLVDVISCTILPTTLALLATLLYRAAGQRAEEESITSVFVVGQDLLGDQIAPGLLNFLRYFCSA